MERERGYLCAYQKPSTKREVNLCKDDICTQTLFSLESSLNHKIYNYILDSIFSRFVQLRRDRHKVGELRCHVNLLHQHLEDFFLIFIYVKYDRKKKKRKMPMALLFSAFFFLCSHKVKPSNLYFYKIKIVCFLIHFANKYYANKPWNISSISNVWKLWLDFINQTKFH